MMRFVRMIAGAFAILCNSMVFAQTDSLKQKKILQNDTQRMDAVDISTTKRQLVTVDPDKLTYNAAADVTSKGMSASDMLAKVPMVEVDMDGNVSMRGNRNIKVLINGRPSGLLAGNLADALRSLSADDIASIEVITNPSVKYDAEGSGGVINIILKDTKLKGNTGNFRFGLGTRSWNLGGTYSVQRGKTNFTANLGGHMWRTWGNSWANRWNEVGGFTNVLTQNSNFVNWGGGPRLTLSVDHQFNKKNSLTVSGSLNTNWRSAVSDWQTNVGLKDSVLQFLWKQDADRFTTTLGYDFNVDYRRKFDKKDRELGLSMQWSNSTDYASYTSNRLNQVNSILKGEQSLNVGANTEFTVQFDFTEPIRKGLTLETGLKSILRRVNSNYSFDSLQLSSNEYTDLAWRQNTFTYYQNVGAAYAQLNWMVNSKYALKSGLRYEATQFGGTLEKPTENKYTGKPYNNVIPYFNLSRKIGAMGFVKINYTQRIQRPSLFYLNPYTNYSDPLNITTGNIYLSPEISSSYELSYSNYGGKGGYTFNGYYKTLDNAIETYRVIDANRVYKTTYGNIGKNYTYGVDMNINLKGDNWMVSINGGVGYINIWSTLDSGSVKGLKSEGLTYNIGVRASYTIGKKWMFELFSRANAPSYSLQGYTANWFFHMLGIKRRFNKDKGGIGVGMDNPFAWRVDYKTENKGLNFGYSEIRRTNMWGFRINFDYSFGGIEVEKPKVPERKLKNDDLKDAENQNGGQ